MNTVSTASEAPPAEACGAKAVTSTRWRSVLVASSLALVALGAGCEEDEEGGAASGGEPEPAEEAPYGVQGEAAVGHRVLEAPGVDGGPALRIKAWYPAKNASDAEEEVTYDISLKPTDWQSLEPSVVYGHAILDAPIDDAGGSYPLVVFSHGYSLNPEWYADLVEHYASRGFVVLAPEHVESDWLLAGAASFDRPRDVARTLDLAEALTATGGSFAGSIDTSRVALVGHSYGGYTALAVAGARFDWEPFRARCAELAPDDPKAYLCAPFLGNEEAMAEQAGLDEVPEGLWPAQGDPRVDAIVPIAGDAYLFNERGLASVTVPMMAIGGTVDVGTPWAWGSQLSYDHAASAQKVLVAFEGADHMIPMNGCETLPFMDQFPELYRQAICFDPVWDKVVARKLIRHFSTAFLLDQLTGDTQAHEALLADVVQPAGIGYVTTLR